MREKILAFLDEIFGLLAFVFVFGFLFLLLFLFEKEMKPFFDYFLKEGDESFLGIVNLLTLWSMGIFVVWSSICLCIALTDSYSHYRGNEEKSLEDIWREFAKISFITLPSWLLALFVLRVTLIGLAFLI